MYEPPGLEYEADLHRRFGLGFRYFHREVDVDPVPYWFSGRRGHENGPVQVDLKVIVQFRAEIVHVVDPNGLDIPGFNICLNPKVPLSDGEASA